MELLLKLTGKVSVSTSDGLSMPPVLMFPYAGFMKAVQSFAASALGMFPTEVLFERSPTLNLSHMNNRKRVIINLEGARIDGSH